MTGPQRPGEGWGGWTVNAPNRTPAAASPRSAQAGPGGPPRSVAVTRHCDSAYQVTQHSAPKHRLKTTVHGVCVLCHGQVEVSGALCAPCGQGPLHPPLSHPQGCPNCTSSGWGLGAPGVSHSCSRGWGSALCVLPDGGPHRAPLPPPGEWGAATPHGQAAPRSAPAPPPRPSARAPASTRSQDAPSCCVFCPVRGTSRFPDVSVFPSVCVCRAAQPSPYLMPDPLVCPGGHSAVSHQASPHLGGLFWGVHVSAPVTAPVTERHAFRLLLVQPVSGSPASYG